MDAYYTYLLLDIATIFFPLVLSFDKKVAFYKQWKYVLTGLLGTGLFFIAWDALFTQWGVWHFNGAYVTGAWLLNLPVEEWLFFLVVPYACTFIYECLLHYISFEGKKDWGWNLFRPVGAVLLAAGIFYHNRDYTFFSFSFCGAALVCLYYIRGILPTFRADAFWLMYLISIVPFFIVNGVLTALPVVIYNNAHNLGIRMYTVPFEDLFYGMLLMLGNVAGMEWARGRKHPATGTSLPNSAASVSHR